MRRGRWCRGGEEGATLVEMAVALAVLMVVIVSVDASVSVVNRLSVGLSSSTQSIDALQVAEEALVQDVHTATAWYASSGCTGGAANPTSTPLYFTANLYGATPCVSITLSSGTLTVTRTSNGKVIGSVTVSNLDPSSAITPAAAVVAGSPATSYTDRVQVVLTQDSPSPTAPHAVKTTMSDPTVVAFNIEYACEQAWAISPGGQSQC